MGKASTSKKVARAAKAAGRPGAKKNYAWPLTMGAVVLVGVLLIVLTVSTNDDTAPGAPRIGDHWHAAYGIYNCNTFAPQLDPAANDTTGLNTHGDGLVHIEPLSTRSSGKGANLARFGQQVGLKLADTSFKTPTLKRKNGDSCGSKKGRVELVTWSSPSDTSPTVRRQNIGDYAPKDGSVWVLAFVAKGTKVPKPSSIANLTDPTGGENAPPPSPPASPPPSTTGTDQPATTTSTPSGTSGPSTTTTPAP